MTANDPHEALEIFRDVDPRVLDVVEQDRLDSGSTFTRELAAINGPFAIRLLKRAKGILQKNISPDQAYINGVQDGIAVGAKLAPLDIDFETVTSASEESAVQAKSHSKISRWLGIKAAKFALASGVVTNMSNRDVGV